MNVAVLKDYRVKIKDGGKVNNYIDHVRMLKSTVVNESDGDCTWNSPQMHRKENWGTGNNRKNRDHPNHCIVKSHKILERILVT